MTSWSFLTNHARVLLCSARDPGMRLRDLAASLGITERSAHGIVTDLAEAGYVLKQKDGRRNRYQIQARLPLPEPTSQEPAIGEVLALLAGAGAALHSGPGHEPAAGRRFVIAVDAGSNQVSVLRIRPGGSLRLVSHGVVSSGGLLPDSVAVSGDLVYLANSGAGGSSYTGFRLRR